MLCIMSGNTLAQDGRGDSVEYDWGVMVEGDDLARNDPETIEQLLEFGVSESDIAFAINIAHSAPHRSVEAGMSSGGQMLRQDLTTYEDVSCNIDARATMLGSMGRGFLRTWLEYRPGGRSNTLRHVCTGGGWTGTCFFWNSGQRQGHWPWRFAMDGSAHRWVHLSFCH